MVSEVYALDVELSTDAKLTDASEEDSAAPCVSWMP
jgi:hypothetical protein